MLLYVTTGEPVDREARPLFEIPSSVPELYMLGMREHSRRGALTFRDGGEWQVTPDWRLDRQVVRLGCYLKTRLGLRVGERVALLGDLGASWIAAEMASLCAGASVVGLAGALPDAELVSALRETGVRLAFAFDERAARRLLDLRLELPGLETVVAPLEQPELGPWLLPVTRVRELADTLDTAENARRFRFDAAGLDLADEAFWHFPPASSGERVRRALSHRELMSEVRELLEHRPALDGDLAYLESASGTATARLATYAFLGDGRTRVALGRSGEARREWAELRPHKLVAGRESLEELALELAAAAPDVRLRRALRHPALRWTWAGSVRSVVARRTGGRLRWILAPERLCRERAELLRAAGVEPFELAGAGEPRVA